MDYEYQKWFYQLLIMAFWELILFYENKNKKHIYVLVFFIIVFSICLISKSDIVSGISLITCGTILLYDDYQQERINNYPYFSRGWNFKILGFCYLIMLIFLGIMHFFD